MTNRTNIPARILPIGLSLAGGCMTVLSIELLISAARVGIFMRMMLGLIGIIFVNSVILSVVAIRISVSREDEVFIAEKIILLGLSLCTGVGLLIA